MVSKVVEDPVSKLDDLRNFRLEVAMIGTGISPGWNLENDAQREELSILWDDSREFACGLVVCDGEKCRVTFLAGGRRPCICLALCDYLTRPFIFNDTCPENDTNRQSRI